MPKESTVPDNAATGLPIRVRTWSWLGRPKGRLYKNAKRSPIRVCLLGSPASGKTCFLAGLAILAESNRKTDIQVHAREGNRVRLDELARTLRQQEWPAPTNTTEVFELSVLLRANVIDLRVIDYPGEDFVQALRKLEPQTIPMLYEHFRNADVLLLLIDPEIDIRGFDALGSEQREQRIRRQDALLQTVREVYLDQAGTKAEKRHNIDIAVVLTKADEHPALQSQKNAEKYFRAHAKPLLEKIRGQATGFAVFPLSSVGVVQKVNGNGNDRKMPACELLPSGYESLFTWIIHRRAWQRSKPWLFRGVVVVGTLLVICVCFVIVDFAQSRHCLSIIEEVGLSPVEKLEQTTSCSSWFFSDAKKRRHALFEERIQRLNELTTQATTEQKCEDIQREVRALLDVQPGVLLSTLEDLQSRVDKNHEDMRFKMVKSASDQGSSTFMDEANRFISDFPAGSRREEVVTMIAAQLAKEQQGFRTQIHSLVIKDEGTLKVKANKIREYLERFSQEEKDAKRVRRATELAAMFAQPQQYEVTLKTSGELDKARWHLVIVSVSGSKPVQFASPQAATRVNWSNATFQATWNVGQPILIEFWEDGYIRDSVIAEIDDKRPIAIECFGRKAQLNPSQEWRQSVSSVFVEFEIKGLTKDDWQVVRDYLTPGDRW